MREALSRADHPGPGVPRRRDHRRRLRASCSATTTWSGSACCWSLLPLVDRARRSAAAATGSALVRVGHARPGRGRPAGAACSSTSATTAGCRPGCCCSRTRSPTCSAPARGSWSTGWARSWQRSVGYPVRSDVRGQFSVGPMTVRLADPFGLVELDRTFHDHRLAGGHAAGRAAARDPARRRLDRVRRQPAARVRQRQRRGRDRARVPPRRRPAPGALAQQRARRRADGAPRGAALAVAGHAVRRQPHVRAPRHRRRLLPRARRRRSPPRSPCTWSSAASASAWSPPPARSTAASWHEHGAVAAETAPLLESLAVLTEADHAAPRHPLAAGGRPLRPAGRGARRRRRPRQAGADPDAALRGQRDGDRPRRRRPGPAGPAPGPLTPALATAWLTATAGGRSPPDRRTRWPRSGRSSGWPAAAPTTARRRRADRRRAPGGRHDRLARPALPAHLAALAAGRADHLGHAAGLGRVRRERQRLPGADVRWRA